jgi:hypothetical protein
MHLRITTDYVINRIENWWARATYCNPTHAHAHQVQRDDGWTEDGAALLTHLAYNRSQILLIWLIYISGLALKLGQYIYILQCNIGGQYCYIPVLRVSTSRLYIVIRTHVFKRNTFIPFNLCGLKKFYRRIDNTSHAIHFRLQT